MFHLAYASFVYDDDSNGRICSTSFNPATISWTVQTCLDDTDPSQQSGCTAGNAQGCKSAASQKARGTAGPGIACDTATLGANRCAVVFPAIASENVIIETIATTDTQGLHFWTKDGADANQVLSAHTILVEPMGHGQWTATDMTAVYAPFVATYQTILAAWKGFYGFGDLLWTGTGLCAQSASLPATRWDCLLDLQDSIYDPQSWTGPSLSYSPVNNLARMFYVAR